VKALLLMQCLQMSLKEDVHPSLRAIKYMNLQVSYSFSRYVASARDSDFINFPTDNANPLAAMGPNGLDRTHQLSFGGIMDLPAHLRLNLIGHFDSPLAGNLGFAPAPVDKTKSSGWLWSWALALESASKNKPAAWQFMKWATSKEYIAYAASKNGWASVPPGTRLSTYQNPNYQAAAKDFAALTLNEIQSVNVIQPGLQPQPVPGIQYVGIPQFEAFGQQVSAEITAAIDGQESVSTALSKSQQIAQQAVTTIGLKK